MNSVLSERKELRNLEIVSQAFISNFFGDFHRPFGPFSIHASVILEVVVSTTPCNASSAPHFPLEFFFVPLGHHTFACALDVWKIIVNGYLLQIARWFVATFAMH